MEIETWQAREGGAHSDVCIGVFVSYTPTCEIPYMFLTSNSVIFASAYRFSVLFSYTNEDPTYTLAPTVGW